MPRNVDKIAINPSVLIWARRSIGMTEEDAAKRLKIDIGTLSAWESDTANFSIGEVRKIGNVYKRPVVALLQSTAPPLPKMPTNFATVAGAPPQFSQETITAIRGARRIQRVATELLRIEPELYPAGLWPDHLLEDNPRKAGREERSSFEVSVNTQLKWASVNLAYNTWRARMQYLGIVVLVKTMPREDCRGFSLYVPETDLVPVIVLNSRLADQAKIFVMFHEYAHLSLGTDAICMLRDNVNAELWCNRFAAALLVPAAQLRTVAEDGVQTTDEVAAVANRFKVSRHVIAIRLVDMELVPGDMYERIKAEDHDKRDWRKKTADDDREIRRPQEAIRISELGFGYANLVVNALASDLIGAGEASDLLDVRQDKFQPLKELAQRAAVRYQP